VLAGAWRTPGLRPCVHTPSCPAPWQGGHSRSPCRGKHQPTFCRSHGSSLACIRHLSGSAGLGELGFLSLLRAWDCNILVASCMTLPLCRLLLSISEHSPKRQRCRHCQTQLEVPVATLMCLQLRGKPRRSRQLAVRRIWLLSIASLLHHSPLCPCCALPPQSNCSLDLYCKRLRANRKTREALRADS
jgi:hypothetical protein